MACQGCGRTSPTRLCCPTCIEFGRTSFFCGQECFTKNWNAHNQLHELLRKKRALADDGGAGSGEASAAAPGAIAKDLESPPPGDSSGGSQGLSLAPLPGGTSIMSSLASKQKRPGVGGAGGAGGTGDAGGAAGSSAPSGVFGSLVGQAKAMFRGPGGPGGPGGSAGKPRQDGTVRLRSPATRHPIPGRPERSRSPSGAGGSQPAPRARHRQFTVQLSLWALAIVTITAGALFYREHERYIDEQEKGEIVLGIPGVPQQEVVVESSKAEIGGARLIAPNPEVVGEVANRETADAGALRSEVAVLRQRLDRHEQMLRYIMNRYVEKGESRRDKTEAGATSAEAHDAARDAAEPVVNMSKPEFVSRSYEDSESEMASRGNSFRKRGGGGDTVDLER